MNGIVQLEERLREIDPALGIDRDPAGADARRAYSEALRRAETAPPSRRVRRRGPGRSAVPNLRRRRTPVFALVLALAALALVLVPDILPGGTPAYAIRRLPSGLIVIDWSMDNFAPNADAMAADLRSYGVDVQITTTPSSPSVVGQVNATFQGEGGPLPPGLKVGKAGTPGAFTWTFDPSVFHGPVTLEVSTPASAGEHYQIANSVFTPGEALGGLQCALGQPLRASAVAARLPALGLTAVWQVSRLVSTDAVGSTWQDTRVNDVPAGYIGEGYSLNDTTVQFTVIADRATLARYQSGSPLSNVPCPHG